MKEILVFKLDEENYAIEIKDIKEIIHYQEIFSVPMEDKNVKGVINLRRNIYTIFDIRKMLSLKDIIDEKSSQIIVFNEYTNGIVVDNATKIIRVEESDITPVTEVIALSNKHISFIAKVEDEIISILDISKICSVE